MEVKIRNIDPVAIYKIDQIARIEGVSRNEYLKESIEQMGVLKEIKYERERFESVLEKVRKVLELNYKQLDKLEQKYEKLFIFLTIATGLDVDEVDYFIEKMNH